MKSADPKLTFPNLQSRLFIGPIVRRHVGVHEPLPRHVTRFLEWYRRHRMQVDLSNIRIDRPVFLFGMPRSGTTLLQDLICGHPDVAYFSHSMEQCRDHICAAETLRRKLKLDMRGERFIGDSVDVSASSPSDSSILWAELFGADLSLRYYRKTRAELDPALVERHLRRMREALWCHGPEKRFFSKLLSIVPQVETVSELFPDARFIHLVRDPRMAANSLLKLHRIVMAQQERFKRQTSKFLREGECFVPYPRFPRLTEYAETFGLDDIRTTAHLWNDEVDCFFKVRDRLPNLLAIRYEDLLARPREQMDHLLAFCDLPSPPPACLPYWAGVGNIGHVHHTNQYDNFDQISEICAHNMQRLGYDPRQPVGAS